MNITDDLITRAEASALLGVSMRTIDRYIRNGHVSARVYPSGAIRVSAQSVYDFLAGTEVTTHRNGSDDGGPVAGPRADS